MGLDHKNPDKSFLAGFHQGRGGHRGGISAGNRGGRGGRNSSSIGPVRVFSLDLRPTKIQVKGITPLTQLKVGQFWEVSEISIDFGYPEDG